jgi:poly(hydroxyalkanoate) depolymerase family esterase
MPGARRRRAWWIVGGILAVLVVATLVVDRLVQFGPPGAATDADHDHVFVADDGTRQHYRVHAPAGYEEAGPLPVMMALHGCAMTGFGANSMVEHTRFDDLADREGFLVVYPTQRRFQNLANCWNSAEPANQVRGEGEPALLAGVAREVVRAYDADPDRIHVSGASSGAGMAVILGATYPDVFASVTSVAGGEYALNTVDPDDPDATPTSTTARQAWAQMGAQARRVPMLVVQGGADDVVPTIVGERLVEQWAQVNDFVDDGQLNDSLGLAAQTVDTGAQPGRYAYETTSVREADGSLLLEYVFVPRLAHAWSGPAGTGLFTDRAGPDAAELAWRFAERSATPATPRG